MLFQIEGNVAFLNKQPFCQRLDVSSTVLQFIQYIIKKL